MEVERTMQNLSVSTVDDRVVTLVTGRVCRHGQVLGQTNCEGTVDPDGHFVSLERCLTAHTNQA
jgi:hypothetical protein